MIKEVLEDAVLSLERQRNNEIENAKQVAIRDKIMPFNAEIDNAYQNAVSELAQKFETDKKALQDAGTKKKLENEEKVLKEVVGCVSYKFDMNIAKLRKQIEETGE